jgi:chemotaxis protein histidine kinase CheA
MAEIKKTANPASEPAKAVKKEEKAANETAATKTKPAPKKTAKKAAATTTNKAAAKKTAEKAAEARAEKPAVAETKNADEAAKNTGKTVSAAQSEAGKPAAKTAEAAADAEVKTEKKAPARKTAAKKAPAKKAAAKKAAPKKEAAPKEEKTAVKEEAKETVIVQDEAAEKAKEAAVDAPKAEEVTITEIKEEPKKSMASKEEKTAAYNAFSTDTLLEMASELGLKKTADDLKALMKEDSDLAEIADELAKDAEKADDFTFEDDGYDIDILPVLVARIYDSIDFSLVNPKTLKDRINAALALELTGDALADTDVYNTLFDTVREVLMIAQQNNIHGVQQINDTVLADVPALVVKFMDVAYNVLKTWQYNDVKYYEGFIYSVLSQFEELHQSLGTRAMMDVADQLILHGDYGLGDANYRYIIRENAIKDMIYFRFASIYRDLDRDKARAIAHEALQWVDGRYDYYQAIVDILNS